MKTILILAAFAALAATGTAGAATYGISADEMEICRTLELAHESSCSEYEARLVDDMTGSIAPATADYIPYLNGMGDPDGLTLSNPKAR
jgi:hypothetical protein